MTAKQRVRATFQFEKTDRVPVNYLSNPTVHGRLAQKLGVSPKGDAVLKALDIDFREMRLQYTGKKLFPDVPDRRVDPLWGMYTRKTENQSGMYWDYCDFPLQDAALEQIARWPMPNPDDFDYDGAYEWCVQNKDYALCYGHPGIGDVLNTCGMLFTVEDALVSIFSDEPAIRLYIDRRTRSQLDVMERVLDRCHDLLDLVWTGEDLGTQNSPLISLEAFRKVLRPRHQQYADLAAGYGLPEMIHSCGSSSWAFDDFLEMGIRAVDTLQPEAANMSPEFLTKRYGGKLVFHGCISTAGKLAYGTEQETRETVRQTLELMMDKRGYCMAPTHLIQDNTPVENILAMYETAFDCGKYR